MTLDGSSRELRRPWVGDDSLPSACCVRNVAERLWRRFPSPRAVGRPKLTPDDFRRKLVRRRSWSGLSVAPCDRVIFMDEGRTSSHRSMLSLSVSCSSTALRSRLNLKPYHHSQDSNVEDTTVADTTTRTGHVQACWIRAFAPSDGSLQLVGLADDLGHGELHFVSHIIHARLEPATTNTHHEQWLARRLSSSSSQMELTWNGAPESCLAVVSCTPVRPGSTALQTSVAGSAGPK